MRKNERNELSENTAAPQERKKGLMLFDIWTVFWRDWIVLKRRMVKFILSRIFHGYGYFRS